MTEALAEAERFIQTLTDDDFTSALLNEDPSEHPKFKDRLRLDRAGEDTQAIAASTQMRAVYASDWFWDLAKVCPNNRLWWGGKETDLDKRREGAPIHYPDYLMLFIVACAGIAGIGTIRNAVTTLRDPRIWRDLVLHMDQYVPDGWTRLSDLPDRNPNKKTPTPTKESRKKAVAKARRLRTAPEPSPRNRSRSNVIAIQPRVPAPPSGSTIDYWLRRWRAQDNTKAKTPLSPDHEYYNLRGKVMAEFEHLAIDQLQQMGVLDKTKEFVFGNPDRNQYVGFDGVVFAAPRKGSKPSVGKYTTGEGLKVQGTKFGITSSRVDGQRRSRVITSIEHIHKSHPGSYASEQAVVREVIPRQKDISEGGIKGLLVDSVERGNDIIDLQRLGITVVNYPHAASNPDGGSGNRLNDTRKEKNHLRRVATHLNDEGLTCEHFIFAVGGELVQVVMNSMGDQQLEQLEYVGYQQRLNADGTRREYHRVKVTCDQGDDFIERVPLFHTSPTSNDPDANWGEYVRVYPPGSAAFKYLYGARNDTEARHHDLKARVKHLPADVAGQQLRLLGAAIASNALSWQAHLREHAKSNVIDDTA
jgi:hypothetical protein